MLYHNIPYIGELDLPDTTLAMRARSYEAKTETRLKSAFLPPDAKMMIAEAAALLVAMAIEIERLTPFADEV